LDVVCFFFLASNDFFPATLAAPTLALRIRISDRTHRRLLLPSPSYLPT
jgi:hypothetical protein